MNTDHELIRLHFTGYICDYQIQQNEWLKYIAALNFVEKAMMIHTFAICNKQEY